MGKYAILAGCAEKDETANLDFDEAVDYDYSAEAVTETEITKPSLGFSAAADDSISEKEKEQALTEQTEQTKQTKQTERTKAETDNNTDMSSETVLAEKAFGSQTEAETVISTQTAVPAASETVQTAQTVQTTSTVTDNTSANTSETAPKSEVVTDCSVPMAQEPSAPVDYDSSFFSEDLFIGDSISTGYSLYGFLNEKNVFAKVGLNPSTVLTKKVSTCYGEIGISDMIAYTSPKRVYIMLGSNGIQWLSTDNMLNSTKTLVALIELSCPDATVAIVSVPPVTPEYAATVDGMDVMEKINEYNDCLRDYCEENDTLFIDAASVLKNSSGYFEYSYAESDGMHFKASAYKVLLSKIQSDVTEFEEAKAEAETEAETEAVTSVSESTAASVSEDKTKESETSAAKAPAKKSSKKNESSETAVTSVSASDKKTEKKESETSAASSVTGAKTEAAAK